jgi:ATP-binding cassette, subfamily B, bacterial
MSRLWNYLKHYKKLLALALVLGAINQIFSLLDPLIFRQIVDNYLTKIPSLSQSAFVNGIIWLLLAGVGVAFVSRVAKNFQDYYVNVITQRLGTRMYADSVSHSFSLPYAAFEDRRSGELLSDLDKARADTQKFIGNAINILFVSLVGTIFVLGFAFYVNWIIGVLYVAIMPILGVITFFLSKRIKQAQKNIRAETSALAGSTTETIRNVELVKSLGLEAQEIQRLNTVNDKILDLELTKVKIIRTLGFLQGTVLNTLRSALQLVMFWLMYKGTITLGDFFSLLFYSFFIFSPLAELGNVAASYQEMNGSLEKLDSVLKLPAEPKPTHPVDPGPVTQVSLQNVAFKYASATTAAVENLSLTVRKGETIAFVGPSGAGKSTVIKLLVGLYEPTTGEVDINDTNLKTIDKAVYRSRLGLVTQDTQLFAGTVKENLLFVKPFATDAEMFSALKAAAADRILERTGEGLETRIGEGGLKLSGGERQRLAIARALLRNPDMLIFDEATSALDSLTEEEITKTIRGIKESQTGLISVLVAHRLSTVIHADRIYVLEKGNVIETGNHQQLLDQKGLYAALWRQQIASA